MIYKISLYLKKKSYTIILILLKDLHFWRINKYNKNIYYLQIFFLNNLNFSNNNSNIYKEYYLYYFLKINNKKKILNISFF